MGVTRAGAVKSFEDETAMYVHFIDAREEGENLECRVWIAPWHQPDDSLERLQIGYQFIVYDEWDFDASIARAISVRIKAINELSDSLRRRTLVDLENPSIKTKRWSVYRDERAIVGMVRSALSDEWAELTEEVAALPLSQFTYPRIEDFVGTFEAEHRDTIQKRAADLEIACPPSSYAPALVAEAFHFGLARKYV